MTWPYVWGDPRLPKRAGRIIWFLESNPGSGRGWIYDAFTEAVLNVNLNEVTRNTPDFLSADLVITTAGKVLKNRGDWKILVIRDLEESGLSVTEQALVNLATPLDRYGTIYEALVALGEARKFQASQWPKVATADADGRSAEEWQLLINAYLVKLNQVYTESDGATPAGRIRYAKYAALFANLALWLVQATVGVANADKKRQAETVVHEFATEQEAAEARVAISTSLINGTVWYDHYTSGNDKPVDGHSYHYSPDAKAPVVENAGGGFQIVHE